MMGKLQSRVWNWCVECFGYEGANDKQERALRLLEEATEYAQAVGIDRRMADRLLSQVYSKPAGNPIQELAGVSTCLLAAASAQGAFLMQITEAEVARIEKTKEIVRSKQKSKVTAIALVATAALAGAAQADGYYERHTWADRALGRAYPARDIEQDGEPAPRRVYRPAVEPVRVYGYQDWKPLCTDPRPLPPGLQCRPGTE